MVAPTLTRRTAMAAVTTLAIAPALPAAARPRTHTILIERMRFAPAPSGVRVGDTVTWVNRDAFRHTATARSGAFDIDLVRGASGGVVIRTAGTFDYVCRFHPGMTGQLVVGR